MTRQIFKFYLQPGGHDQFYMPIGWKVAHVGEQRGSVTLWAEVDPAAPRKLERFYVYMTGQPIAPGDEYLGTAILHNGDYVVHVYRKV